MHISNGRQLTRTVQEGNTQEQKTKNNTLGNKTMVLARKTTKTALGKPEGNEEIYLSLGKTKQSKRQKLVQIEAEK